MVLFDDLRPAQTKVRRWLVMVRKFGPGPEGATCGRCALLERFHRGARQRRKCRLYGDTASTASDWLASWAACGAFRPACRAPGARR
jgi:hypothetical protein